MKVAILANDTTYTYNLRKELIRALLAQGDAVVVIGSILEFKDELIKMGCQLIDLHTERHGKNPIHDFQLLRRYISILKDEAPDIALTFNIKPNVYGGMACKHLKIRYLPNITGLGKALEYPGLLQIITKKLYRTGVSRAETVFFQNAANRSFFVENHLLSRGTSSVILPGSGVDLERFAPTPYPKGGMIQFLFVSRLLKEKGIDLYLGAAKKISGKYNNVSFHICGQCDDVQYENIISEASKCGYVQYHGEQQFMKPFYEMANCVVHPSYYPEGMSNVCLEAAACARPVITTDRSGCAETVDDGKSGYLIPVRDEEALIQAIERFLTLSREEQEKMGLEGRRKVEMEFDRKLVVQRYMQAIHKEEQSAEIIQARQVMK